MSESKQKDYEQTTSHLASIIKDAVQVFVEYELSGLAERLTRKVMDALLEVPDRAIKDLVCRFQTEMIYSDSCTWNGEKWFPAVMRQRIFHDNKKELLQLIQTDYTRSLESSLELYKRNYETLKLELGKK